VTEILAFNRAVTNADLMVKCRDLGYISQTDVVLDVTFGEGRFWSLWTPPVFVRSDIAGGEAIFKWDFRKIPLPDGSVNTVILDAPYKLSGTANRGGPASSDASYGINDYMPWQEKHQMIRDGITETSRLIVKGGHLLLKCMDQVCSGEVRWQTYEFKDHAEQMGLQLVDRFDLEGYRKQPTGRRQVHARRNHSTLLVFKQKVAW